MEAGASLCPGEYSDIKTVITCSSPDNQYTDLCYFEKLGGSIVRLIEHSERDLGPLDLELITPIVTNTGMYSALDVLTPEELLAKYETTLKQEESVLYLLRCLQRQLNQ